MKWNVDDYTKNASYVYKYGEVLLEILNPQPNEIILDLGCGKGQLTKKISLKAHKVLGIDSSEEMVTAAIKRGVNALVMGGEKMKYQGEFHAVFSNAALHWMKPPNKVIENVFNSLKKGGHFCAEMGGSGNVKNIITQIYKQLDLIGLNADNYNPWYFPSKKEYERKLKQAGFQIKFINQFERPTKLPTDIAGWLKTFAKPFLKDIPKSHHKNFIQTVKNNLSKTLKNKNGDWYADYVRLRFEVIKND